MSRVSAISAAQVASAQRAEAIQVRTPAAVVAPEPGLDVTDGNLAKIGCERCGHRRQRVAVNEDAIGLPGIEGLAKTRHQPRQKRVERLVRGHDVKVDVGHDPRDIEYLVEHLAMLGGDAYANLDLATGV